MFKNSNNISKLYNLYNKITLGSFYLHTLIIYCPISLRIKLSKPLLQKKQKVFGKLILASKYYFS